MTRLLSSPARADAAYGREIEAWWVDGIEDILGPEREFDQTLERWLSQSQKNGQGLCDIPKPQRSAWAGVSMSTINGIGPSKGG